MVKTLQKHGNSAALVIDKGLQEAMGITPETPLQITVSGSSLIVTPLSVGVSEQDVANSLAKLRPRYQKMLENLAK